MTGATHAAVGAALGLAAWYWQPLPGAVPLMAITALAALLPDIDHAQSTLGRRLRLGALIFHHRRFTHSLLALALVVLAAWHWLPSPAPLAVAVGYGSHILLDVLNPQGVRLWWPLPAQVSLFKASTGGLLDDLLRAGAGLAVFLLLAWMSTGRGY